MPLFQERLHCVEGALANGDPDDLVSSGLPAHLRLPALEDPQWLFRLELQALRAGRDLGCEP
jgi:hypothetical protein